MRARKAKALAFVNPEALGLPAALRLSPGAGWRPAELGGAQESAASCSATPQLATLATGVPASEEWSYEIIVSTGTDCWPASSRVALASLTGVVVSIAVLLGLKLLWAADPIWGGFGPCSGGWGCTRLPPSPSSRD